MYNVFVISGEVSKTKTTSREKFKDMVEICLKIFDTKNSLLPTLIRKAQPLVAILHGTNGRRASLEKIIQKNSPKTLILHTDQKEWREIKEEVEKKIKAA